VGRKEAKKGKMVDQKCIGTDILSGKIGTMKLINWSRTLKLFTLEKRGRQKGGGESRVGTVNQSRKVQDSKPTPNRRTVDWLPIATSEKSLLGEGEVGGQSGIHPLGG